MTCVCTALSRTLDIIGYTVSGLQLPVLVESPDLTVGVIFVIFYSLGTWDVFNDRFKKYDNGLKMTNALMKTPGNLSSPARSPSILLFLLSKTQNYMFL